MSTRIINIPIEKRAEVRAKRTLSHKLWRQKDMARYNSKQLRWANENREKRTLQARNSYLGRKFKLKIVDVENIREKQKNRCGICGVEFKICVDKIGRKNVSFRLDHNHETGEIRGLLCNNCNLGIGYFKDSVEFLLKAKEYLLK